MTATEIRQSEENLMSTVWSMIRHEYGHRESVRSITPWGGDRAIVVTDESVYDVVTDERLGFTAKLVLCR